METDASQHCGCTLPINIGSNQLAREDSERAGNLREEVKDRFEKFDEAAQKDRASQKLIEIERKIE